METYTMAQKTLLSRVFSGLFMSLLTACIGLFIGRFLPQTIIAALMFVELIMIVAAMFIQRRKTIGMGFVLAFTLISGITLYPVIAYYTSQLGGVLVMEAVGVSAAAFLIAAIVASQTSFDFSFLGGFLLIGLFAILLMGIVSIFIPFSTIVDLVYSLVGIALFIGYVLFDVNRIAHHGVSENMIPWVVLSLYLDFINLLLFVLRLLGVLQSSRR